MTDPELLALIDEFYVVFDTPAPAEIHGCECCTDPAKLQRLLEIPLHQLTGADLEQYASSVCSTISDDGFRHFWPRLVELALRGEIEIHREILFDKPRHGEWRTEWSAPEQELMERFAATMVRSLVAMRAGPEEVDSWVCAIGRYVDDITRYLDPLLEPTTAAVATFGPWYDLNAPLVPRWRLANTFWGHHPNADRLRDWFERPDVVAAGTRERETRR